MVKYLLLICLFFGAEKVCHKATDGFALTKLAQTFIPAEDLIPPREVFESHYSYLGKGGQCYVFASEKYVLKFFRTPQLRILSLLAPFSSKFKEKENELKEVYQSCLIAKNYLKEETGLIGLHLNPSDQVEGTFRIFDKLKIEHLIDAKSYSWIIQKKAELVQEHFLKCDAKEARSAYLRLMALIEAERKKGVVDSDANLSKNFGFVGETPIQIDIGRFSLGTTRCKPKEEELYCWLKKQYPHEF